MFIKCLCFILFLDIFTYMVIGLLWNGGGGAIDGPGAAEHPPNRRTEQAEPPRAARPQGRPVGGRPPRLEGRGGPALKNVSGKKVSLWSFLITCRLRRNIWYWLYIFRENVFCISQIYRVYANDITCAFCLSINKCLFVISNFAANPVLLFHYYWITIYTASTYIYQ